MRINHGFRRTNRFNWNWQRSLFTWEMILCFNIEINHILLWAVRVQEIHFGENRCKSHFTQKSLCCSKWKWKQSEFYFMWWIFMQMNCRNKYKVPKNKRDFTKPDANSIIVYTVYAGWFVKSVATNFSQRFFGYSARQAEETCDVIPPKTHYETPCICINVNSTYEYPTKMHLILFFNEMSSRFIIWIVDSVVVFLRFGKYKFLIGLTWVPANLLKWKIESVSAFPLKLAIGGHFILIRFQFNVLTYLTPISISKSEKRHTT